MKGEKLYSFLNSLNQAEKNQCTRYLLPGGKRESRYALLYKILTEQDYYDENETLRLLYGMDIGPSQRRFEATCDYLGELVVKALAAKDEEVNSRLPLIRKAREKGLIKVAGKHLQKAVGIALEREDFEELLQLFQEHELIEGQYNQKIKLNCSDWSRAKAFEVLVNLERLGQMLEEFRSVKWMASKGQAEESINRLVRELQFIEPVSKREEYLRLRLLMRVYFIQDLAVEACNYQEQIMTLVYESGIPRIQENRVQECGHMLRLYYYTRCFEKAETELMRLRATPTYTPYDQSHYWRFILTGGFISAFTLGNIPIGRLSLKELSRAKDLIPVPQLIKLYFYAALFLSMNGNWKDARPHLQTIQKFSLKDRKLFLWQPDLLMALGYIEEEEPDMASLMLSRIQRKTKGQTYPSLVTRGLERILYASSRESGLLLKNLQSQVSTLRDRPETRLDSLYFDIGLWIESKLQKRTMIEISKSQHYESARIAFSRV